MDPVTLEVIRSSLEYIAEEMGVVLRNSAYSPNIKERMDHSCAIFDDRRRLVAQAEHIPVHLGSMAYAVGKGLEELGEELEEGDVLFFNDPYVSGTHLPDVTMVAPVYREEELVAYVANKAHHSDVGGMAPGSMPGDATELIQEGIVVPPVKLVRRGRIDESVLRIFLSNVRTPKTRLGDIRAQVAALKVGAKRVAKVVGKYGLSTFKEALEELLNYSERRMRAEISKMPKGVAEAEDVLESTGPSEEELVIRVRVAVGEGEISFDYSGTSEQVEGPVNAAYGVTLSGVFYVLMCVTDPTIPVNHGCFRAVSVRVPEGTILNPTKPAPVGGGNVETSQRNVDVLFKAFSQIVPEKVCAAGQGTMNNVCIGGTKPSGEQWTFYETIGGGYGGRKGLDGLDGVHVHMTNTMNTPIEVVEANFPLLFLSYKLREDSGGAGRWRGGCGIERSWKLLSGSATLSLMAERTKVPPYGLFGGKPGAKGVFYVIKPGGRKLKLKSKCTVRLSEGDVFVARTPGGGGYGDPKERDLRLLVEDLLEGKVSVRALKEDYGLGEEKLAKVLEKASKLGLRRWQP